MIAGFHPDPSVCRVGDLYYLATSSFTYFPGVPIFRSHDLVTWEQIGNVLDRPSQLELGGVEYASFGVYAPTIREHDGQFFMTTTVSGSRRGGTFFVTTQDPDGPWSDPVGVDVPGIDPDLAWDDDGDCWMHFAGDGIMGARIDDQTGAVVDRPVRTWSGTGLQYPEAPHLYRHGGYWYLLIAEGGTERGHAVSVARGPSPAGPWEGCPANPIVSHRSTAHPIQNTGHADLVEAADGSWWMVLLGVRPRGFTPGFHVLGRETFLVPVTWVDDWPVVAPLQLDMPNGPRIPTADAAPTVLAPGARDDFDSSTLAPQWISIREPLGDQVSLTVAPGRLELRGNGQGLDDLAPAFVGRRQQQLDCRARCAVDPRTSTEAGLVVRMDEDHHYEVFIAEDEVRVRARIGPLCQVLASATTPTPEVVLRVETHDDFLGPDLVMLGFDAADGSFEVLAELDGRYLSTEVATGFIGRVIGMYVVSGVAAFDWFEIGPLPSPTS